MERLFASLNVIKESLEQIQAITQNQTTVLLETVQNDDALGMLEQMFNYKETLMQELEQAEVIFQAQYQQQKGHLEGSIELIDLKKEIGYVLKLKEEIIAVEQRNLLLMGDKRREKVDRVELPQNPVKVVAAYKKHTKSLG